MSRSPAGPILVVDDDAEDLARFTNQLGPHGRVLPCGSAHEASRVAASLDEPPLTAVIDVALGPGPDGVHVFAELRARFPQLPALVTTGGAWFRTDTNARLAALGSPYWFRPKHEVTPEWLAELVRFAREAHRLETPDSASVAETVSKEIGPLLTEAQIGVLPGILRGEHYAEIAAKLGVGVTTVKTHVRDVLRRTDHANRQALRDAVLARARTRRGR